MSIVLITTEPLPLPGVVPSGAGIRAWALAEGLRAQGFSVEIGMAEDAGKRMPEEVRREQKAAFFQRERLTEWVRERNPEILLMQHWGLMDRLGPVDCPLAIDLAGPHLLERYFWESPRLTQDVADKIHALERADFLCCSGHFQRHYFLAFALLAGFDPADSDLLPVVPYCLSPELPDCSQYDPERFVYAGMLLPWQNAALPVESLVETLEEQNRGRLTFLGGRHPAGDVSRGKFDGLIQHLEKSKKVSLEAPQPYQDLLPFLSGHGAALDLMAWNAERELAFTSRTVVYLAAGLPVLYNDYSELSGLIAEYDAGWALNPEDRSALEKVVRDILERPEQLGPKRQAAQKLVREKLNWTEAVKPLARWCQSPRRRSSKNGTLVPLKELEELRERLENLEGRRLVRLSNWLRGPFNFLRSGRP